MVLTRNIVGCYDGFAIEPPGGEPASPTPRPREGGTNRRHEEADMRKIVAGMFMSLDGVMESPEKWTGEYMNDEMVQAIGSQMAASDTMLLGRRTYQDFAAVWPSRTTADFGPVADFMNTTPKLV